MALAFLNRCVWRATSTGTGSFVVASAITGYKVPNDCAGPAVVDAATYFYFAQSDDKTQWEIGYDAFDVATSTLPRTNILDSTNAGAAVSFSAAPSVFMGGTLANDWPFGGVALDGTEGNSINITAGAGDDGGSVSFTAGAGSSGNGGSLSLVAGDGSSLGGGLTFTSGFGGTGNGGTFNLQGGNSTDGDGGSFNLNGGVSTNSLGGGVNLLPGSGGIDGGDLTIGLPVAGSGRQGLIIATNVPTADPTVTDALFNKDGFLAFSGTTGSFVTNPMAADLDVGGFSIIGADDAVGGTDGGPIVLAAGAGTTGVGGNVDITGGAGDTDGGDVNVTGGAGNSGVGGPISITPGTGDTDGGDLNITLPAAGSGRQGLVIITGLPTSDPGVSGALYVTAGAILISP